MSVEGLKILIVDDEPEDRHKVRRLLGAGYSVSQAELSQGREAALLSRPDCVLVDVHLPGPDTFGLLSALTECGFPVVLLTGDGDEMETAARAGADGYLSHDDLTQSLLQRTIRFAISSARRRALEAGSRQRFEKLYHAEAEIRRDLEGEMRLARDIQFGLLPRAPLAVEGFEIHGLFVPSRAISGDFLDYYPTPDGTGIELLVGDVTGHGLGPAILSVEVRASLRALSQTDMSEAEKFAIVNRFAHEHTSDMQFASAFLARLDVRNRRLQYTCAGHDAHLLRANGDSIHLQTRGLPLGAMSGTSYERAEAPLQPGDMLLVMTDGVFEARRSDGALLGCNACVEAVAKAREASASELCELVLQTVQEFTGNEDLRDDATILVVKARD
jgi:serine phosphatase RsbU (regulator of sigma subunit)